MRQLTQQEAERCARALEYEKYDPGYTNIGPNGELLESWSDKEGRAVTKSCGYTWYGLSRDPHFWRPRLEDRLCDIVEEQFNHMAKVQIQLKEELCTVRIWDVRHGHRCPYCSISRPICESLCAAIEQLTKE